MADEKETALVGRRIIESIEKPISGPERDYRVGISLGVAFFPADGQSVPELLQRIDAAMYAAKKEKCGLRFYRDLKA